MSVSNGTFAPPGTIIMEKRLLNSLDVCGLPR